MQQAGRRGLPPRILLHALHGRGTIYLGAVLLTTDIDGPICRGWMVEEKQQREGGDAGEGRRVGMKGPCPRSRQQTCKGATACSAVWDQVSVSSAAVSLHCADYRVR